MIYIRLNQTAGNVFIPSWLRAEIEGSASNIETRILLVQAIDDTMTLLWRTVDYEGSKFSHVLNNLLKMRSIVSIGSVLNLGSKSSLVAVTAPCSPSKSNWGR